ncbi:MAG: hypothetical protein A2020_13395 [Lentisphaerae bacterium GWF2_45_14]|nr:MAG: hypothetical protein A2020_13395 [Lentisphaerae bacterium GWF2_45_14]
MIKKAISGLCLFFAVLISVQGNIVRNGDFEPGPWSLAEWTENKGSFEMDGAVFRSGKTSLKITNSQENGTTLVRQGIKLNPNTEYKLSFYIKGSDIVSVKSKKGGGGVLVLNKGEHLMEGSPAGRWKLSPGTYDWRKCEFVFNSGSAENVALYLALVDSSGTVWFDDIALEEVPKSVNEILEASLYPVDFQKGIYNVPEGFPCTILFSFKGDRSKLKNLRLTLEMPEDFRCLGASPWHVTESNPVWKWAAEKIEEQKIERNGRKYTRYTIEINATILKRLKVAAHEWNNYERLYVESIPGSSGKSGTVYWRFSDLNWQGKEQQFEINSMAPLAFPSKKLGKFGLLIGYLNNVTVPFDNVKKAYVNYWTSLSEKPVTYNLFGWNNIDEATRNLITSNFNTGIFIASKMGTPSLGLENWIKSKKLQIPFCVSLENVAYKNSLCPEYLVKDPEGLIWNDFVPSGIREKMKFLPQATFIDFDFEPGAMNHCFCETCRKRFSSEFTDAGKILSSDEIKKKYPVKWFEFRVKQHAEILAKYSASLKKYFPKLASVLVTDPLHSSGDPIQQWCGVDIRLSDNGEFSLFRNMPYYCGPSFFNDIKFNNKVLKTPNFNLIDPSENMEMFYKRYTPEGVRMNIVASAALGCKGIGFWPNDCFDGKYLQEIVFGCSLVAKAEDYYFSGQSDEPIKIEPLNVFRKTLMDNGEEVVLTFPDFSGKLKNTLHRKGDGYLVTVFNYDTDNDIIANVMIPNLADGRYEVVELNSGLRYTADDNGADFSAADIRKGFMAEIARSDVKVIEIRKLTGDKSSAVGVKPQTVISKKLKDFKGNLSSVDKFPVIKEGNAETSWGILKPEKIPMMKMSLGESSIYIDTKSANVAGWRNKQDNLSDVLRHKSRGLLGNIIMNSGVSGEAVFSFEKGYIKNGAPSAEFMFKVPAPENADPNTSSSEGLIIKKIISLENKGQSLRIHFTLLNQNPFKKAMKIGFRIKNYPMLGNSMAGEGALSLISKIIFKTPEGESRIASGSPENNLYLNENCSDISFLKGVLTPKKWTYSEITVVASDGVKTEKMTFVPDKNETAGFYSWWSEISGFTVELISKESVLEYGKSLDYEYIVNLE